MHGNIHLVKRKFAEEKPESLQLFAQCLASFSDSLLKRTHFGRNHYDELLADSAEPEKQEEHKTET